MSLGYSKMVMARLNNDRRKYCSTKNIQSKVILCKNSHSYNPVLLSWLVLLVADDYVLAVN